MVSCHPSVVLLSQPGTRVHGPVPPTFRDGFLSSAEPLEMAIHIQICAPFIFNAVRLVKITHHSSQVLEWTREAA